MKYGNKKNMIIIGMILAHLTGCAMDNEPTLVPSLSELASAAVAKQLREQIDPIDVVTILSTQEKVLNICATIDSAAALESPAWVSGYMGNYYPHSVQLTDKSIVRGLLAHHTYQKPEIISVDEHLVAAKAPFLITLHVDKSSQPVSNDIVFWKISSTGTMCRVGSATVSGTTLGAIAANAEGTLLVTGSDRGEIFLWDISDLSWPRNIGQFVGHPIARIEALCFVTDKNGKSVVVSTAGDQTVGLWNITNRFNPNSTYGFKSRSFGSLKVLALIPERYVLVSANHKGEIKFWDLTDSNVIVPIRGASLPEHDCVITSLKVTHNNTMLISGCDDGVVKLWDITDLKKVSCIKTVQGHKGSINELALLADNNILVCVFSDKTMEMWDISNPAKPDYIRAIAQSNAASKSLAELIKSALSNDTIRTLMPYKNGFISLSDGKITSWQLATINYALCLRVLEKVVSSLLPLSKDFSKLRAVLSVLSQSEKSSLRELCDAAHVY